MVLLCAYLQWSCTRTLMANWHIPVHFSLTRNLYVRSSSSSEKTSFLRLLSSTIRSGSSFSSGCWFLPERHSKESGTGMQNSKPHHHWQHNYKHHDDAELLVLLSYLDLMGFEMGCMSLIADWVLSFFFNWLCRLLNSCFHTMHCLGGWQDCR